MNETIVLDTPDAIERYRLCALRGALKLEKIGMKRRGRSARSIVAEMLGVSTRTPIDRLLFLIAQKIERN